MTDPFLKPRLTGPRFDDHGVPLELLKDLAVLQEMIVEVAKWKYLEENKNRQRTPRGFSDDIELKLIGIEEGSAKLTIALIPMALCLFSPNQHYYENARDAIVNAIEQAQQDENITALAPNHLGYFDRIGRSLRANEAIEFSNPMTKQPARLTKEIRKKLIMHSAVQEFTQEIKKYGRIPEIDQDKMSFELQMFDGTKVSAPLLPQHKKIVLDAINGYDGDARVQIDGVGQYSRQGKLNKIESVEHITLLNPRDVPARLDEFHGLQDGWLEGKGVAPNEAGLNWLAETFEQNFPDDLQLPYLYPTESGGIQAEWPLGKNEITLEINLLNKKGDWHCLNMESDEEDLKNIDLAEKKDWQWLAEQIRTMAGSVA